MVQLGDFDANAHKNEFDTLPAGDYLAQIIASERKPTKSGNGDMLVLTFKIISGDAKGRQVTTRLNVWNANDTARKIALAELGDICRATGVLAPKATEQLHGIPITIKVIVRGEYNDIKGYRPRPQPEAAPVQQSGERPSWA